MDPKRVGYLGPAGTHTDEALRASADPSAVPVPIPTVREAVLAVQEDRIASALVPIENSLEGGVAATLDALAVDAPDVSIRAETVHPIHHQLIGEGSFELDSIERVLSHPQALGQCGEFLRERLPDVELVAANSTADAVRSAIASGERWAAIGSRLAAETYGGEILAERIEDRSDNVTRFVWLSKGGEPPFAVEGPLKTSVVFWGFNDESPGALVSVLSEFSERGINLTKIESRPRRVRLGHYMFFADLSADIEDEPVAEALEALRGRVETLRVLGCYPAAVAPLPG